MRKMIIMLIVFIFSTIVLADKKFGNFTGEQICIAAIATNNGRHTKDIRILSNQNGITSVAYTRDDGKIFGYTCKIEDQEIRWRDQRMSNWNKNIKLYYTLNDDGSSINIRSVVYGEAINKSFKASDF